LGYAYSHNENVIRSYFLIFAKNYNFDPLGIIVNQSVKGTVYIYIGVILGFITTGILLPRIYSTEQVGLLKILVAYSSLIASFGTLGFNGVSIRLFPFFKDERHKHHGYLVDILLIGMIGFLISTTLLLVLKPWISSFSAEKSALFLENFNYLIILIFFQIFFSLLDAYNSALLNILLSIFLREVLQRILIILSIGLYFIDLLNFNQFVILYITAISLPTLFIIISLIQKRQFSLQPEFKFLNRSLLITIASVSASSILNGFSLIIIQNVDVIMINGMIGLGNTGVYSVCFFFGLVISLPARSIIKIVNVVSAQAWKENNIKLIQDIYSKSCLTLFIIGLLLFIGLWANIHNILHILGPNYSEGKWVIFFIGLSSLFDMITGANGSILGTSKYYAMQTGFMVILVFLLILINLVLIPRFGITGAAMGGAVSLGILNLMRYLYLLYKFEFQPFNIRFVYVAALGAGSYYLSILIPQISNFIVDIGIRSLFLIIVFCTPVYFMKISDDINNKADEIFALLKLKKQFK